MKKNILLVISNLRVGGAEKNLISLLHEMNYEKYNVDIFLFQHDGRLLKKIPPQVNLLDRPDNFKYFDSSFFSTFIKNLLSFNWKLIINRIKFSILFNNKNQLALKEQKAWKHIEPFISKIPKNYDLAYSLLEKTCNYFVIDKVTADKKILSVMTDYEALGMIREIDLPYFEKATYISVLSIENQEILQNVFPEFKNKIMIIENMISEKEILKASNEKILDFPTDVFTIISVGRIVEAKLHTIGVEIMKHLKERKLNFKWLIIGDGDKRNELQNKINESNLENYITIFGEKENPYPYIKNAGIFLHLSKFEGYGIAIAEARILKKCIVLNDFTTAATHVKNGFDGVIAPLDPEKIANEIGKLIADENLRRKYEQNVSFDKDFAQKILRKIDDLVEN